MNIIFIFLSVFSLIIFYIIYHSKLLRYYFFSLIKPFYRNKKNYVTGNLIGGLGNQLFQIFAIISYSYKHKIDFILPNYKLSKGLDNFSIRKGYSSSFFYNIKDKFSSQYEVDYDIKFKENAPFNYKILPEPNGFNIYLQGYFQNSNYFVEYLEDIIELLGIRKIQENIKNIHNINNCISLHFRIGDYNSKPDFHYIQPIDYYIRGIETLIKSTEKSDWVIKYCCEEADIIKVNENIKILKSNFKDLKFERIDKDMSDWEQMIYMSLCEHNIIANSTFSWWSALFNRNKNKIIIIPEKWINDKKFERIVIPNGLNKVIYSMTCVSGYWKVKNKHDNKFEDWFENTLKINCPYIFFGDEESIELVKNYRKNLPTYYIKLDIEDFITYKYKNQMVTDSRHCPSIELNLIWNEKIFMIQRSLKINPFSSNYFCWVDAGVNVYREIKPPSTYFPNLDKLNKLPKDTFIYTSSECKIFDNEKFKMGKYHLEHHISGTYILHKNIVNQFAKIYQSYLKIIDKNDIYTDQVILTMIYRDNKELFYKLCDGYGSFLTHLK